eukprot:UN34643
MKCNCEIRYFFGANMALLIELISALMIYFTYWLLIALFYWGAIQEQRDGHSHKNGDSFAYTLGLQGVVECCSLILTNLLSKCAIDRGMCDKQRARRSQSDTTETPLYAKNEDDSSFVQQKRRTIVNPNDFEAAIKFQVLSVLEDSMVLFSSNNLECYYHGHSVKVVAHCWNDFAKIRKVCGIQEVDYHHSFNGIAHAAGGESGGASGAIFSRTSNNLYRVKGLSVTEAMTLKDLMPSLAQYWTQDNPDSLICRVFGLYSVSVLGTKIWFMVMEDVFAKLNKVHEVYDLKGSTSNRSVGVNPLSGEVLKDADLRAPILVKDSEKKKILASMQKDSNFLMNKELMDYSLLLGIEYKKYPVQDFDDGDVIYNRQFVSGIPLMTNYAFGI